MNETMTDAKKHRENGGAKDRKVALRMRLSRFRLDTNSD